MNYEDYEDLNKAKKRIMSLLKTKYGDVGIEYSEQVDTDADGQMSNIIKQLDSATSLSFQMIPFIRKEADRVREVYTGDQVPVYRNDGITQRKNNKGELMWEDETEEEVTPGNAYYRNVNSLLAFNQHTISLSNILTSMNRIFIKLIDDIGYVEPPTLDLYKKSYEKYLGAFNMLNKITIKDGFLNVMAKDNDGEKNEFDRPRLIYEFHNIRMETHELVKFHNVIDRTYNYKSNTVGVKKNGVSNNSSSGSRMNYLQDDDEE